MNKIQDVRVWGVYSSVYKHGHNSKQGCWASVKTLHQETGLSIKLVQRCLSWLVENQWLIAEVRPGHTTVYRVTPLTPDENALGEPKQKRLTSSVENDCTPQSKTTDHPSRKRLTNKNPLTRTHKQEPINKTEPPSNEGGCKGGEEKKDPFRLKRLPSDAIPADLLGCADLIAEFWGCKKGTRSERVFNRICNKLKQWTPEQRQDALERAIAAGWGDVFEPRPQAPHSASQGTERKWTSEMWAALDEVNLF